MIILFSIIIILILFELIIYNYLKFKKTFFPWILFIDDLYPHFEKKLKKENLYQSGELGDHVNKYMNKEIANHIKEILIKKNYISPN